PRRPAGDGAVPSARRRRAHRRGARQAYLPGARGSRAFGLRRTQIHSRILGRAAPAHRHRPRAHHRALAHHSRRGGLGARRLHPRADSIHSRRSERRVAYELSLHIARLDGVALHHRPCAGDEIGRNRRGGRDRGGVPQSAAPLYARTDRGDPEPRAGAQGKGRRAESMMVDDLNLFFDPTRCFIGGEWRVPNGQETLPVENPSTGGAMAEIARGTAADVDHAIMAARPALSDEWGRMPAADRGRLLTRIGDKVAERVEDLARIEAMDVGKPLKQARADALALARYLEFYGGACDKIMGETIPYLDGYTVYTLREPHG